MSNNPGGDKLNQAEDDFLIVGLGASAGGIGAFKEFFARVPADSGMAYVVILHLSPEHDSRLAEVLQVTARIPVTQVTERVRVVPDHVYVIPPNRSLSMADGHLTISDIKGAEERRAPVDLFFRTLAESQHSRAVCVVLSGTGPNGSMGLKRVKELGGIAIVQDPNEAEYADMPRNSIATDLVDYILPVAEIPATIIAYKERLPTVQIPAEPVERQESDEQALRDIFTQLRVRTGHDFTNYKRATVLRRLERRISVHQLSDLLSYSRFVREHPDEVRALLKDLLISVTNFFRDPAVFKALEQQFIPKLFEGKEAGDQVRVWVAGCATGEEAYSIAILLAERASGLINAPAIQVFASDIEEQVIAAARDGYYTDSDVADVSPERLRRFFAKESEGYRVRRELREMVLFAHHNLIKDPPFSRLDLVSCRNLLIYLNRTAQERVMEVLHFALRPGGYLLLGTSESPGEAGDLFMPCDKDAHIYQSRAVGARAPISFPDASLAARIEQQPKEASAPEHRVHERVAYIDLHQRLLEAYGPPSVVINENYDIVHLSERAGRFLQLAGGEPSLNLLRAVRPELRPELRTALNQAVQRGTNIEARALRVRVNDHTETVNLIVRPIFRDGDPARGFILVLFEATRDAPGSDEASPSEAVSYSEPAMRQLEDEIERVKAQLRATVERHEVQQEELKASNEELQAMNEELRSAAEELETSKEELHSVNEELTTVNQELKIKIEELSQTNNDFQNLMASTDIGTIFLDRQLRVKLFTPRARDIFNFIPTDAGRPLLDITSKIIHDELLADAVIVLDKLQSVEREVLTHEGEWYLMRMLPYRTIEDRIDGVVVSFVNITDRKRVEQVLQRSHDKMEQGVKDRTAELVELNQTLLTEIHDRGAAESRARGLLKQVVTAQESERRRIARDLHDHLGQQLTALRLKLEALREMCGDEEALCAEVEQTQALAGQLDRDVDFLSRELRPSSLDDLGLVGALANFVAEWSQHFGVPAEFHSSGLEAKRLSPDIETGFYRIAQEALNNIYKHAGAKHADVLLERRDDLVVLIIEDDGRGFDPSEAGEGKHGMGLVGMRERAVLVGGTLEIESEPGRGTTIFARVPVVPVNVEGG